MSSLPTIAARSSVYRWLVVAMLWFVCFFNYADRQAIFSVFPLIREQMRLTDVQLSVVAGAFMWMYALFGPFAGWLADRLPRKTLVLGALVFWSAVTGATALTQSYGQLVFCRALGGLGEAFYFPAAMSLIGDYHAAGTRSRAMSLHQSAVYAGSIAGGAVSGYVGQFYGWRSSFTLFGGVGVVLGGVLWAFLREPPRGMSEVSHSFSKPDFTPSGLERGSRGNPLRGLLTGLGEVLANPAVRLLTFVFIGANFVASIFLTWMPTFLYRKFHMSLSMAGLNGTAYLQVASVLGVVCGGLLADRLVRRRAGGRMLAQSFGLLCGVPFLFLTGWTTTVPLLVLAMVGFGYFKGIYDANIFASLYDVVPVARRGAAAGVLNSLGWLGGGFAPVAIAVASRHYGMSVCISATAAIYLAIGLLLLRGGWRLREAD